MLTDLTFKPGYTTPDDDIGKDFYNKALSVSNQYDRVTGYFTAGALLYYAKGLESLYANQGHFRLIMSAELPEEDYNLIKNGYDARKLYARRNLNLPNVTDSLDKTKLANVGYLIQMGLLDIKVGFIPQGLFHAKYGIISDSEGNRVYFSGSFNETANAFKNNFERIDIKQGWLTPEYKSYVDEQQVQFDDFWNEERDGALFLKEFDDLLKDELITYSKGRFIVDSSLLKDDALVVYYEDNNGLHVKDNLVTKQVNESQRRIRNLKIRYMDGNQLWNFRHDISYKDIEKIVSELRAYGEFENITIVVSDSVNKYIESSRFEIDEIYNRGLMLKNKDSYFDVDRNAFIEIVNSETIRPLRDIQAWVSYYMTKMKRRGNFSVPGAGKTAMMYGTFAYLSSPIINEVDQLVVIGPKSSFLAWKDEYQAMFGNKRTLNVLDVQDSDFREEQFHRNVNQYDLIMVNYESLSRYAKDLKSIINARTMVVFDEVHKVKGVGGVRADFAVPLADNAVYRYVLTGTPIPNSYEDVYNLLHILFKDEYDDFFGFSPMELKKADLVLAKAINEKFFPFYWRVTKSQLGVPEANPDHIIAKTASDDEQAVIDLLWKKYSREPFKLYIRLMQFASNPELLLKKVDSSSFAEAGMGEEGEGAVDVNENFEDTPDYDGNDFEVLSKLKTTGKFEASIDLISNLISEGERPVVWAVFIDTIDKIAKRLNSKGYRVAVVYGQIAADEREKIIKDFQQEKYDVIITNPHTLAESVSLHHVSHAAVYVEYTFNLTHMLQSRDRIHRLGLPEHQETNYYYMQLAGQEHQRSTIDALVYERLEKKRDIMINAIEGTELTPTFNEDEKAEIIAMMQGLL